MLGTFSSVSSFSLTLEAKHGFCCFLHSVDSPPLPSTLNVLIPTPTSNHFQKLPSCQGPAEDSFPLLEATVFFLLFYFLATPKILVFGSSSLTRDQTEARCTGSSESQPQDYQGSPNSINFGLVMVVSHQKGHRSTQCREYVGN